MAETPINPEAILADLLARRAEIDAAIGQIRRIYGLSDESDPQQGTLGLVGKTVRIPKEESDIRSDTFFGLSVPNAVKKYLKLVRAPASPQAIVAALGSGGQENPNYTNVYTALKRLRGAGEVRKLPTGEWGLSEWYPNGGGRAGRGRDVEDSDDGEDGE